MKKYIALITSTLLVSLILAGCGTKRFDEKLDEEYNATKSDVGNLVTEADSMTAKLRYAQKVHDEQDTRIEKKSLSAEDKKMQDRHDQWFKEFEPTLAEIDTWIDSTQKAFSAHDAMETTHDNAAKEKIQSDHDKMMADLIGIEVRTEDYLDKLIKADSLTDTFFIDHAYLMEKYKVPSEHGLKPPTAK